MKTEVEELLLAHYGVKGMKWGVRRQRNRVRVSSDYKRTAHLRGRKPSELTDRQLKAVTSRINLELNYSRLNPSKIKSGQKTAKALLAGVTTAVAVYNIVNSPAGKAAIETGKKLVRRS